MCHSILRKNWQVITLHAFRICRFLLGLVGGWGGLRARAGCRVDWRFPAPGEFHPRHSSACRHSRHGRIRMLRGAVMYATRSVCRRLGKPRPEQDIDLNPGSLSRRGRAPGLGQRTQVRVVDGSGPTESSVESSVSQPLRLSRADPTKRGREIKRYFQSPIIGHGVFSMWGAHVEHLVQSTYGKL